MMAVYVVYEFMYELPQKMPYDLRPRILGNKYKRLGNLETEWWHGIVSNFSY